MNNERGKWPEGIGTKADSLSRLRKQKGKVEFFHSFVLDKKGFHI
jgi:hypothetical protein